MTLEEKLRQLKLAAKKRREDESLERQLEFLRRMDQAPNRFLEPRAAKSIEEFVQGRVERRESGEYFVAEQLLPLGRPYGKLRVGDIATSDLCPLNLFIPGKLLPSPERLVFLDTETTGLAGGTGTCAFLIGLGTLQGTSFAVRQLFLRDYVEEKAALEALAEALEGCDGLVTFNGKTFDVPLLETRYTLSRLPSPFTRLLHLDMLHPARKLWKLRLESCKLTHLERQVLGIEREGDVPGSDIPGIYFDYLRTGDARGLQPVFYHNALDIITLAALAVEMANFIGGAVATASAPEPFSHASAVAGARAARAGARGSSFAPLERSRLAADLTDSYVLAGLQDGGNRRAMRAGLDLFSLSRVFAEAGASELSISAGEQALASGLPEAAEPGVLWHLAAQRKRRGEFGMATGIWLQLSEPGAPYALQSLRELAIQYEHRERNLKAALKCTDAALAFLEQTCQTERRSAAGSTIEDFSHRRERLCRRLAAMPPSPTP